MENLSQKIIQNSISTNIKRLEDANSCALLIHTEDKILFIKRALTMPTHKGDLAFVGGHLKDEESLIDGCIREYVEETSLNKNSIKLESVLTIKSSMRGQKVVIVSAKLLISQQDFLNQAKSNGEWDDIFFESIETFKNKHRWSFGQYDNKMRINFCALDNSQTPLWGMTASVVHELFKSDL
ncbi:MAG: NUDIX hydrolase [Bacteriovoracaceae bacterium]|jgi:ADP-ribose pyrophosphatase YjhB (NUDIX family)|nr:NUDIX hydrolase [Bacteriovoracaceae bacterium]